MRALIRLIFTCVPLVLALTAPTLAQENSTRPSQCLAVAQALPFPDVKFASFNPVAKTLFEPRRHRQLPVQPAAYTPPPVKITYIDHSTYRIESVEGVIIATDYNDWAGSGPVPTIVTMNKAHSGHYSVFPDPKIKYPLKGWNPDGDGPAQHNLLVKDVLVRNVATDIRTFDGGSEMHGNSIFIFEIADLCIGHLGPPSSHVDRRPFCRHRPT